MLQPQLLLRLLCCHDVQLLNVICLVVDMQFTSERQCAISGEIALRLDWHTATECIPVQVTHGCTTFDVLRTKIRSWTVQHRQRSEVPADQDAPGWCQQAAAAASSHVQCTAAAWISGMA
jgi:hypothetical protein